MSGLTQAVRNVVTEKLRAVWIASVARIDRVYHDDYRCDLTLAYTIDGEQVSISKVPIMVHRSEGSAILIPYKAGDLVLVVFDRDSHSSILQFDNQNETYIPSFGAGNTIVVASLVSMPDRNKELYKGVKLKIPTDEIIIVNDSNIRLVAPGITS